MSDPASPASGRGAALPAAGPGLALAAVAWAVLAHYGMGPDLAAESPSWWAPSGFLRDALPGWLGDGNLRPLLTLTLPVLLLAAAVIGTTRSALARFAAASSVVATACFTYYGTAFPIPWEVFEWRWSATMALFAVVVGGTLSAVWLTRSWRERSVPLRVVLYLPVFVALVVFERNVTGTDPDLPFALSPWPAVQVLGLETVATATAFVLLGVGEGLWAFARLPASAGRAGAIAVGVVVATAFPSLALGLASSQGLLPFQARPVLLWLLAGAALGTLTLASLRRWGQPARLGQRSRLFNLAALLLGAPLLVGQTLTRWDYAVTRNDRAQRVVDALAAYYADEQVYPDTLEELVEEGHLDAVPRPRVGFVPLDGEGFVYQSFGTSFLLEFSAPRWIQCTYNPPYADEDLDPEDVAEGGLGGSWSCPSNPPELW